MNYISHLGIYDDADAIQAALNAGTLGKPYVALNEDLDELDYNTMTTGTPAETRVIATYRIENAGDSIQLFQPCEANFWTKIELDGTDIKADIDENGNYTFQDTGDTAIYFSFAGHDLSQQSEENGDGWFAELTSLVSLYIPDHVTAIGQLFCNYSDNLAEVHLSESLTTIPLASFGGCSSLSSITLPPGITNIEDFAFNNVLKVYVNSQVPPTVVPYSEVEGEEYGSFLYVEEIVVPCDLLATYQADSGWTTWNSVLTCEQPEE